MYFIRRIGRDEIYIKYVHQLVNVRDSAIVVYPQVTDTIFSLQMHLQSQNYVEAALTLKLHADLHQWDLNTFVAPMEDLHLPQQSQFHRKETLCLLILDYLGKSESSYNSDFALICLYRQRESLGKCYRHLQRTCISTRRSDV